ncbi:endopeptidase La [Candidatus Sumerlaeota bacterium]|nr:endopeptidase La [Candidatus Sumerlaeota bacterium]
MARDPLPKLDPDALSDLDNQRLEIPPELPVMAIENIVIYPYMIAPIIVADDRSKRLVDDVLGGNRIIGLFTRREEQEGYTGFEQLFSSGTAGVILKMLRMPDGTMRVLVHGMSRIQITEPLAETPYLRARVEEIHERVFGDTETQAMIKSAQHLVRSIVELSSLPEDFAVAAMSLSDPGKLADLVASNLSLKIPEQQEILELADTKRRLARVLDHLGHEIELLRLGDKIQDRVRTAIDKSQREYMLREQLKAIRHELGETEEGDSEISQMRRDFADESAYPEHVRRAAERELSRLEGMSSNSAEYTVSRTYLDWLHTLPWERSTDDHLDIRRAKRILDEDHCGLERIKERILEYLAVLKLKANMRGPILCFVGPPGVGKTSLGRSIARALGRQFHRFSLGGLHDEAEIRGHRRTYIGAMPGRIIKALRTCDSNNPVVMLDEIDKVSSDFRGDPASALLEVLDPEQNHTFTDNYLDLPFDLSRVMFITTANMLDTVAPPLRDRMEVLSLSGYTPQEKREIARLHLVPKQIEANGLRRSQIAFTSATLDRIIEEWTRESGVRNLERQIGTVCRKVARTVATRGGAKRRVRVEPTQIARLLGKPQFDRTESFEARHPGVAVGLAWTPHGGELLAVEVSKMPGTGKLSLTGQLGDVMKESAQAAMTHLRANAKRLGIADDAFKDSDIHIHVPEGAIPKDGPSAGITIATALASLMRGQRLRPKLAMTGEITLKGSVLPVGGIKAKVLAAHRAGIHTVLLPSRNRRDLTDIPKDVRDQIEFRFVSRMSDVLRHALPGE